jgi:TRAP-type uncharacterized transport system substrate-binding protein
MLTTFGNMPIKASNESFPKIVSFGTGSIGGAWNMVGVDAAKYWDKELGLKAKVAPGASLSNLHRFGEGRLDMLVGASTWGSAALLSESYFNDGVFQDLSEGGWTESLEC